MTWLRVKHLLLRSPLEKPAQRLRYLTGFMQRLKHPELQELYLESDRIEQVMRQILQPNSNCIDVGCHIGSSLSSMIRYAPRGRHIAFEPIPEKADWIRKKFPEVDVKTMALGDKRETLTFYQNISRPGFSSLAKGSSNLDEVVEVHVDCERLDDIVETNRKFAYIKIDVEGAELLVLRGARRMIERDRPMILFESSYDGAPKLGLKRDDLFTLFVDELGYEVFMVRDFLENRVALNLAGFQKAAEYPFQAFNFLAVPGLLSHK
jgi:FkbM family methyltransferase